jgi:hypothetical protein
MTDPPLDAPNVSVSQRPTLCSQHVMVSLCEVPQVQNIG